MSKKLAEVKPIGTFMTFYGYDADAADLLTGQKPYKEKIRFYIDFNAKEPEAVLLSETYENVVSLSDYKQFGMITRTRRAMSKARKGDKRRSAKLGFEGSGVAMNYTQLNSDGEREYVRGVARMTAREVLRAFVVQGFKDFRQGNRLITAEEQYEHARLIGEYLDQHGA